MINKIFPILETVKMPANIRKNHLTLNEIRKIVIPMSKNTSCKIFNKSKNVFPGGLVTFAKILNYYGKS